MRSRIRQEPDAEYLAMCQVYYRTDWYMSKFQIQLSESLYHQVTQRANDAGFESVDAYVADVLESELCVSSENFDHLFTDDVVRQLKQIDADAQAGAKTYSQSEVDEHFRQKSRAWREAHGS